MPGGRSFSFEENDEQALSSNLDERLNYDQQRTPDPFHFSPPRDIVSPPPQYSSPPPREDTISPPSPLFSHVRPESNRRPQNAFNVPPRRPVASQRSSGSSAPPPPPPHRTSPTRVDTYGDQRQHYRSESSGNVGGDHYNSNVRGSRSTPTEAASHYRRVSNNEVPRVFERPSPPRGYSPEETEYQTPVRARAPLPHRVSYASYTSNTPLNAGNASPGFVTPTTSPGRNGRMDDFVGNVPSPYGSYHDSPYHNSSVSLHHAVDNVEINPYNIADDGDDGFIPDPKRRSMIEVIRQRSNEQSDQNRIASGDGAGAATMAAIGGLFSRTPKGQTSSGSYNRMPADPSGSSEKVSRSDWLARQKKGNNRMRWVIGGSIIGVVLLAVIAGIVGGVISSRKAAATSASNTNPNANDNTAAGDEAANGDLGLDSPEIKALLNNPNLHKVFPGIDYTPWGTQYPLCFTYPPSQNNVTRDMAVLSQLTNAVRLYGTDCNQTQMVLHSIDRLKLTDMKVWLGVWIDTNETTTIRQIQQMYDILQSVPDISIFKGVIVGNEALYRAGLDKAQSEQQLIGYLSETKSRFASLGYNLPVATSDLGTNWNAQLVEAVDLVMSNIHPFFAGVTAEVAASWTWDFWQNNDVVLTNGITGKKQIISETGWPSGGGRDCGGETGQCYGEQLTGDVGVAIAGIDGMNTFMDAWVCQALDNGTEYFWFEAFDEPWKIIYDKGDENWEDKWGLMDPGRSLKEGLVIPDCGGRTVV